VGGKGWIRGEKPRVVLSGPKHDAGGNGNDERLTGGWGYEETYTRCAREKNHNAYKFVQYIEKKKKEGRKGEYRLDRKSPQKTPVFKGSSKRSATLGNKAHESFLRKTAARPRRPVQGGKRPSSGPQAVPEESYTGPGKF